MAPNKDQRYQAAPPIPTYDEAVSGSSRSGSGWRGLPSSSSSSSQPINDRRIYDADADADADDDAAAEEGQSLLNTRHAFESAVPRDATTTTASARRNPGRGYRQATVESDDDDDDDDDDDEHDDLDMISDADTDVEAAHVRAEMQEMEILDGDTAVGSDVGSLSAWGKRIGLAISLPRWRWRWQWPLLPRMRIRLGSEEDDGHQSSRRHHPRSSGEGDDGGGDDDLAAHHRRWLAPSNVGVSMALVVLGRVLAIMSVLAIVYLLFMSDMFENMARRMGSQMFNAEQVRIHVQGSVSAQRIRDTLRHFTSYAHMAGTEGDFALAIDTRNLFEEYGLEDVMVDDYYVYLNYPRADGRAVEILDGDGGDDARPIWTAKLEEEDVGGGGETAGHQTYVFHGHSKSGDVRGPLIYANYGSREDFAALADSRIDTRGAIALVRYYGSESDRALKVKAAEMAGFAGCIIYSDPADDGFLNGDTAPSGRFMPADGVQRGAVSLMSWVVGDVLTPGWASKLDMPRMRLDQTPGLVGIPSIPLAWRDAQVLLQHIRGFGEPVAAGWTGGVPDVGEWWTGNLSSPVVRLRNEQDEDERQPIWNVYGRIVGAEQHEKKIIVGNHRDAWTSGAVDPNSGTAVMLEVARIFGDLLAKGWRPLRTIEFMSWDAEEYNLIGSTEYVEQNDASLRQDALAYINLDTAVSGDTFRAAGSPVFNKLLLSVLHRVGDPNYNTTLRDLWDRRGGQLEGLGAGSDYVAFQDIVGTSSLDMHFGGPAFPYHSSYENFEWMETVGDPGFVYHVLLGQILGLLVLELADRPVMPFDMAAYTDSMTRWVEDVAVWGTEQRLEQQQQQQGDSSGEPPLNFSVLREAADEFAMAVREFERWEVDWETTILANNRWEPVMLGKQRCEYNSRMALFETDLLDSAGIPNRTQFKHVVFGPQLWSGYDEAYFPGIRDIIQAGNWALANQTVDKVAAIIKQAAANLIA